MAMQHSLLFPYGEDKYMINMNYVDSLGKQMPKGKNMSMREYYAFVVQQHNPTYSMLLRTGELFNSLLLIHSLQWKS